MRKKFYRIETLLLSGILGMLGFSCSGENIFGEERLEYGSPYVDFVVKGTVTDENQKPIKGIQVVKKYKPTYDDNYILSDTVYTDDKGQFERINKGFSSVVLEKIDVEFKDIDGEQNGGSFSDVAQQNIKSDFVQTKKGERWFQGEFTLTLKQILKKK